MIRLKPATAVITTHAEVDDLETEDIALMARAVCDHDELEVLEEGMPQKQQSCWKKMQQKKEGH